MSGALISVRVQPGARQDQVAGYSGGVLRVKVAAPPIEGKANEGLLLYMARLLGIRPGQLVILKGARARNKLLRVEGLEQNEAEARFASWAVKQV